MTSLGEPLSNDEFNHLMQIADVNKDGKISYGEFVKILTKQFD